MKKALSLLTGVLMIASMFASTSLIVVNAESTLTQTILDFESTAYFPTQADMTVTHETQNPLNANGSLKATFSGTDGEYPFDAPQKISIAGWDGIVYRVKTDCTEGSWLRVWLNNEAGTQWAMLGNGVSCINMAGQDVTPASHSLPGYNGPNWDGFSIPANFDGYIFVPMTGTDINGDTYSKTANYGLRFMVVSYDSPDWGGGFGTDLMTWFGKTYEMDSIAFYNGADKAAIMNELTINARTKTIVDFEASAFFPTMADMTVTQERTNPLNGNGSLKATFAELEGEYPFDAPAKISISGWDGLVYRVKTDCTEGSWLRVWLNNEPGTVWAMLGNGVKCINMAGQDVTPSSHTLPGYDGPVWNAFSIPASFDGYIFVPMTGIDIHGDTYSKTANYGIRLMVVSYDSPDWDGNGFGASLTSWQNKTYEMDSLSFYKGTNYEQIINELTAPKSIIIRTIGLNKFISNVAPTVTAGALKSSMPYALDSIVVKDKLGASIPYANSISTGCTAVVTSGSLTETFNVVVFGDVDGATGIGVGDLAAIKKHIIKQELLTGVYLSAADLFHHGSVTISDLMAVKKSVIGIGTIDQNQEVISN